MESCPLLLCQKLHPNTPPTLSYIPSWGWRGLSRWIILPLPKAINHVLDHLKPGCAVLLGAVSWVGLTAGIPVQGLLSSHDLKQTLGQSGWVNNHMHHSIQTCSLVWSTAVFSKTYTDVFIIILENSLVLSSRPAGTYILAVVFFASSGKFSLTCWLIAARSYAGRLPAQWAKGSAAFHRFPHPDSHLHTS